MSGEIEEYERQGLAGSNVPEATANASASACFPH